MNIIFVGHSHHQKTGSSRFFISFLETLGEVSFLWDEEWINPSKRLDLLNLGSFDLIVVWQIPSIARRVPKDLFSRTVYVPMYDAVSKIGARFWRKIRGMRVISFSHAIHIECLNNKVQSIHIQYYPQAHTQPPNFSKLSLFFWQRQSIPNWRTISVDVPTTQFDRIHLHSAVDPGNGKFIEPTESDLRILNIQQSSWFEDFNAYLAALASANVFIAPRLEEGIGMALLEAMQRGMVCIANNAPTMNEYIVHGMNGYLTPTPYDAPVIIERNQQISIRTLQSVESGHRRYLKQLEAIRSFMLAPAGPRFRKILTPAKNKLATGLPRAQLRRILSSADHVNRHHTECKLTIVTVVRNDVQGLIKTLASVASQSCQDFEYLIIDGKSTDQTASILKGVPEKFAKIVSEADSGPYDAMNKGARVAQGEFVLYLNAGDTLYCNQTVEFLLDDMPPGVDIIYGHHVYHPQDGSSQLNLAKWLPETFKSLEVGNVSYTWLSGIPCHQSTITRRKCLIDRPYDLQFRIAADHDFLFDQVKGSAKTHHHNTVIANYYGGGLSSKHISQCVHEWKKIALKHTKEPNLVSRFYDEGKF
ncbi:glycosyltransferase [Aquabacterium sp.]|uniref:glycosyltransferase n=1 Tax=Aquabacterium sp. TaxID=1872578 RepID=UPI002489D576|nr:glycosyltransferase [Aquabacterium sp.]MDI1347827.1 glycosyltransferase [Aquabacterium sp.]